MASRATQTDTGIDPQIAELLGLDFTADLDREDYISLLKEKMMAGRMSSSKLSSEETEILTDEFKRIKKDTQSTFKVKKTKISADSFQKNTPSLRARSNQKALPGTGRGTPIVPKKTKVGSSIKKTIGDGEGDQSILEKILAGVTSILGTLKENQNQKKKIANTERRQLEKKKRKGKEDKLESGIFKGLAKAASKILKPVEGLLSRILKFIGTILIGKLLQAIVTWISDPKNEGKLEAIGKFLEVTWPGILGAFLAFSTGFGGVITGLIALVARFIPRIAATILRLAASNPLVAAAIAGAGLFVTGAVVPKLLPGTVDEQERKTEEAPGTKEEKITKLKEQKKNLSLFEKMQGVGLEIDDQIEFLESGKTARYAGGGKVPGSGNSDTVPAMLTPGEFVMSKGAVKEYGVGTLASMNAMGGGTNRPMIKDGTTYAKGGGSILGPMPSVIPDTEPRSTAKPEKPKKGSGGSLKNLKGQDFRDLAYIVSAEAQRGTDDEYGVAAAVLNRVADPAWPNTVKAVGSQAGQFEAVYTGKAYDDEELAKKFASADGQARIVEAMKMLKGRTDFKGTSQYGNMGAGDVKFSNGGNFYHYKEQVGKTDPAPTPLPSYYKKFIGTGGPSVTLAGTTASTYRGSSSISSNSETNENKSGGGGFEGLLTLSKLATIGPSSSSSTSSATIGSKTAPKSPPPPPVKQTPKVSVLDSSQSSGDSNQEVPKLDSGANVNATIPSPPKDSTKCLVLGIPV